MLSDLKSAFKDVFSNKIRGLIALTVLTTLAVFAVLFGVFVWAMSTVDLSDMPRIAKVVEILGYFLFFIVSLMLFPAVATFAAGFFIDSVVDRMAKRDGVTRLRTVPLAESVALSGVVALKGIGVSMLLMPVTLLAGWVPLVNLLPLVLYYGLNGRLLAREYFYAVALRYLEKPAADKAFEDKKGYWTRAGVLIAVLMTVPVVNVISPLIAMAFMQRLFGKQREVK